MWRSGKRCKKDKQGITCPRSKLWPADSYITRLTSSNKTGLPLDFPRPYNVPKQIIAIHQAVLNGNFAAWGLITVLVCDMSSLV